MRPLIAVALLSGSACAQYLSPHLNEPERSIAYVDSCARFWMPTWDEGSGGFFTNIGRTGQVSGGRNKNLQTQSRNAYGLTRAYQLTGDVDYLDQARAALDWMLAHAWDAQLGGWYSVLGENGQPQSPNDDRSAFDAHYALLGLTAYYEATGDEEIGAALQMGLNHLETTYWDARPGLEGYYDHVSHSNTNPHGKSFNATVDALTTHMLLLDLMNGEDATRQRIEALAGQMVEHLVASMPQQAIGFVEKFDSNWQPDNGETMTIMGHVLKTAWCLGRIHRLDGDPQWLDAATVLLDDVWERGYDHELGGPYKDFNRITGQMLMWGNPDTCKAWWQMEQAVVAGLMLNGLSQDERPLQMADETLAFFMRYFVDPVYGEVYENRTRSGAQAWNLNKGGSGKAGYHSIETGYYAYLYGKLLLHGDPATLRYRFAPAETARSIRLTPMELAPGDLEIAGVMLDGAPYAAYDAIERTLELPVGTGGEFTVDFRRTNSGVADPAGQARPGLISLEACQPNPFNPATTIPFTLALPAHARLTVHDLLGRHVATLLDQSLEAGGHQVRFESGRLPSGLYLVTLEALGQQQTQKIALLR
jgi:mannose/cellobiose epimerase-like protein (N-acyl-D-glucosamine 2-epimerase family)